MVKQSCQSLTEYFGKSLPDNEIAYLTMLFGGSLRRQDENFDGKIKAIIVYTRHVSITNDVIRVAKLISRNYFLRCDFT